MGLSGTKGTESGLNSLLQASSSPWTVVVGATCFLLQTHYIILAEPDYFYKYYFYQI